MEFEYDPQKSISNLRKHGIDFEEAKRLWADGDLVILSSKYPNEKRYLAIGIIESIYWTAVFTERKNNIRLISVRRSRIDERNLYERHK